MNNLLHYKNFINEQYSHANEAAFKLKFNKEYTIY